MKTKYILLGLLLILITGACKKTFLEVKPNKALLVPETLADLQALLDNVAVMNRTPTISTIASDEFVLMPNGLTKLKNAYERGAYLWSTDPYEGSAILDWNAPYEEIFYANVVLDALEKIEQTPNTQNNYNSIKGSALFFRAYALQQLLQIFTKPYAANTAKYELGVPMPLLADVNIRPGRSNIQTVYDQVIADLKMAISLLPDFSSSKNRPSRAGSWALLARVYLNTEQYDLALQASEGLLRLKNDLLDYNMIKTGVANPFPEVLPNGNAEILFYSPKLSYVFINSGIISLEPSLKILYAANDLRDKIYFYDVGGGLIYNMNYQGLAIDEVYLIKAESLIRLGQIKAGMDCLNLLLVKRWKTGTFVPYTASSEMEALQLVINERRKELVGRGLRWGDLRRYNQDPRFAITWQRTYNGTTMELGPLNPRYTFPIPDNEIFGSGIEQN